jgi:hypothetical protein
VAEQPLAGQAVVRSPGGPEFNVMVTRARRQMLVVTSLPASAGWWTPSRAGGPAIRCAPPSNVPTPLGYARDRRYNWGMSIAAVTRELLVRYLDSWTPGALQSAKRATFAQAWSGEPDVDAAEAALRVFAEFADRLRGRRLAMVLIAPSLDRLTARLDAVQKDLDTPAALAVHTVAGPPDRLATALKAAGAAGAPLLCQIDTDEPVPLSGVTGGRPGELLLVTPAGGWEEHRQALRDNGFPLTTGVDLVAGGQARLVAFATTLGKHLEAFKDALWAVDEYAGVRYRDPTDPGQHAMDISLNPNPGPLRRELLAHLVSTGERTVTELRYFALTETIFRASDAVRAVTALVSAGSVTRTPERGRLSGDVVVRAKGNT